MPLAWMVECDVAGFSQQLALASRELRDAGWDVLHRQAATSPRTALALLRASLCERPDRIIVWGMPNLITRLLLECLSCNNREMRATWPIGQAATWPRGWRVNWPSGWEQRELAHQNSRAARSSVVPEPPVILCPLPCTPWAGVRQALWAYTMLQFVEPQLRLVIIGDGPQQPALQRLAADMEIDTRVVFQAAAAAWPRNIAQIWLPLLIPALPDSVWQCRHWTGTVVMAAHGPLRDLLPRAVLADPNNPPEWAAAALRAWHAATTARQAA